MPEINGLETTMKIRKLNKDDNSLKINDTKFILYSCLSNTLDLPQLRKSFDDVANKPTDVTNLKQILIKFGIITDT